MFKKLSRQNIYFDLWQREVIILIVVLVSLYSYTLFHSLAEIIAITIGYGVYMVTWNSRRLIANKYFVFLGVAFFFVATFDLLHVFSFQKSGALFGNNFTNLSEQFWLAARYVQAFSFLMACFFIGKSIKTLRIFYFSTLISIIIIALIIWWPSLTPSQAISSWPSTLAKISELIICLLQIAAMIKLTQESANFNKRVYRLLMWALVLSLISEIILIFYDGSQNHASILAHLFKLAGFNLIYIVFIEIGLRKPFALLFKEIKDSEMNFRRSEQKFHAIFNNATVGILMTDLDGRIIECNQRFTKISQYSPQDLSKIVLFAPNLLTANLPEISELQELRAGRLDYYNFENKYHKKDGTVLWGDTSVSLVKEENNIAPYILWIIHDVTETKDIEYAKTEFISLVSHQLRTHLTSVRLGTELLLRSVAGPIDNKQARYLGEIHDSTKRMTDVIKNLLNVSRVELGTYIVRLEAVSLEANIQQILNDLTRQLRAKKLQVCYDDIPLPKILFDAQVIKIILENLLANAISYTPPEGTIRIQAKIRDNSILLAISDTGCGIPEEDKNKIFTKLFRAKNAREICPSGNGLGLYIVKALAEQAGGEIHFESQLGEGTTFYISFPLLKKHFPNKQEPLWPDTKNTPLSEL
ncbi:MAG: MASE3 domain-containing protein [Patescibacteria group bacterium]